MRFVLRLRAALVLVVVVVVVVVVTLDPGEEKDVVEDDIRVSRERVGALRRVVDVEEAEEVVVAVVVDTFLVRGVFLELRVWREVRVVVGLVR
jgi:hypothetical protein